MGRDVWPYTGDVCPEKFFCAFHAPINQEKTAGGVRPTRLRSVCVEPPPSAVRAKAKAPAPDFSGFVGESQALEQLSGDDLGEVFLPHLLARLPDCGKDGLRGDEALVELHPEKPGLLVELHPHNPGDIADFDAHGVGAADSQEAALFFHTFDL